MSKLLVGRAMVWAAIVWAAMVCGGAAGSELILPPPASAQPAAPQRTVEGLVVGAGETPLPGAVVYLKDLKTANIRSFISLNDGGYRFGQMTSGSDYELWADYKGKKSSVRSLSSFDNRKQSILNLKIDAK